MSIKNNTTNLQSLLEQVNNLPNAGSSGIELPELTNEGTSADLMSGKQLINDEGSVVTGTFTIDSEISAQDTLIANIKTALQGKAAGKGVAQYAEGLFDISDGLKPNGTVIARIEGMPFKPSLVFIHTYDLAFLPDDGGKILVSIIKGPIMNGVSILTASKEDDMTPYDYVNHTFEEYMFALDITDDGFILSSQRDDAHTSSSYHYIAFGGDYIKVNA